ncbi:MAG: transporter [Flavicella sp.]
MNFKWIFTIALFLIGQQILIAQNSTDSSDKNTKWTSSRADGHAPMGVMADHVHHKGEFMVSYRLMHMQMKENLQGNSEISNATILEQYHAAPKSMQMQMHMFGMMFAPSDKLTLLAMTSYRDNTMKSLKMDMHMHTHSATSMMRSQMSMPMETSTSQMESMGFGDVKLGALYQLFNRDRRAMHLNVTVSMPTGSLTKTDVMNMGMEMDMSSTNEQRLGYAMQLGSGTWDLNLGTTYLKQYESASFGLQANCVYRLGENSEGYTLGNQFHTTLWTAYSLNRALSTSFRVSYIDSGFIKGNDMTFMSPMMSPVFNTSNTGKQQLDLLIGLNYGVFKGSLKGLRFQIEAGLPVFQDVNGIQMKSTFMITTGLQYSFAGH